MDSHNLPDFDRHQFEGRLERPISRRTIVVFGATLLLLLLSFWCRSFLLQIWSGKVYAMRSENNRLPYSLVFGERGVIYDRNQKPLAWNMASLGFPEFSRREYLKNAGLAHIVGYLKYPSKDSAGFYYKVDFEGIDGVEKFYGEDVAPQHGLRIVETDAKGAVQTESVLRPPKDGRSIVLSIDARLEEKEVSDF